jgi:hypothetical protein
MRSQILLQGKNRFLYQQGAAGATAATASTAAASATATAASSTTPPPPPEQQILHGDVDDASLVDELGPLPDGWERRVRPDGQSFEIFQLN